MHTEGFEVLLLSEVPVYVISLEISIYLPSATSHYWFGCYDYFCMAFPVYCVLMD